MYEDTCYAKPFLREVITRIDFVAPVDSLQKSLSPKLANLLSRDFPISEPVDAVAQELQLTAEELRHRQTRFKQWNFYGKEREKQLALAASFVYVKYELYTTYEDMKAQFKAVVDAIGAAFPDARASRFGLRYINSIENVDLATPTSWGNYISAGLLGTIDFFKEPELLTRLIQIAELRHGDLEVRFQFGMPNPDHPALMKRPQFVLDLDAYVRSAHDLGDSLHHMDLAHEQIQLLFESSITDQLRERMNA